MNMNMTTEFIERLREKAEALEGSEFNVYGVAADLELAARVIEDLSETIRSSKTEKRWIPCDEKPPEYDKEVLLKTKDFGVVVGIYSKVDVCGETKDVYLVHYSIDSDRMTSVEVTAWMPYRLPGSYKEDE